MSMPDQVSRETEPSKQVMKAALEMWSASGSQHTIPVSGSSMLPLIHDGDQLLVTHDLADIRLGDILLFQGETGMVAHRLLAVQRQVNGGLVYITHGDNLSAPDAPVASEMVIGRVLAILRGSRQMRLDTPAWRRASRLYSIFIVLRSRLYGLGRGLKRTIFGTARLKLAGFFHQAGRASSRLLLRALQSLVGRWRE